MEQRLNLSRSQDKAYSHAYNTLFLIKVVYNGFIFLDIWNCDSGYAPLDTLGDERRPSLAYDLGRALKSTAYWYACNIKKGEYRRFPSMDSDLEAFSHNPADGSFGALPFQATP